MDSNGNIVAGQAYLLMGIYEDNCVIWLTKIDPLNMLRFSNNKNQIILTYRTFFVMSFKLSVYMGLYDIMSCCLHHMNN